MQIESIEIKNYRLFRDARLQNIPRLCVLVGANGTGKSTLFDVFSFLKDALAMNVGKAVAKRGGYKELASRGFTDQPIEFTLQFRLEITGYERLVTYILKIEPDATGRAVSAADLPALVGIAVKDLCHQTNPRPCTASDFEALFASAL